jgi:molybdopterin converting factor small subunit
MLSTDAPADARRNRNNRQPTHSAPLNNAAFSDSYKLHFNELKHQQTRPVSLIVHVRLFGVFRSAAKTSELNLQIPSEHPTVKAAISQLIATDSFASLKQLLLGSEMADPRPNALIMVSGREIGTLDGLETKLAEDDELSLLPVTHGG